MGSGNGKFFKSEVVHNKYLWYAFAISVAIIVIVYTIKPMREILSLDALSLIDWLIVIGMSLLSAVIIHLLKRLKIARQ